jgi:hypothetical protein
MSLQPHLPAPRGTPSASRDGSDRCGPDRREGGWCIQHQPRGGPLLGSLLSAALTIHRVSCLAILAVKPCRLKKPRAVLSA